MAALRMLIWVLLSVILAGEQADGYAHCKGCKFTTQDYAAFSDTAMSNAAASRSSVLLLAEGPRAGVRAANAESTLKLLGYSPSVRKLAQAGHTSARTDLNLWGNKQHAGLVLLAPHLQRLPDGITASSVLDFFDRGGSLVLTLSPHAGSLQRDVAASLGVDLSPNGSVFSRSTFASSEAHSLAHAILLGEHAQPDALSSVFSSNASGVDLSGCMPLGAPADSDTVLPVLPANGGSFAVTSDGLLVGSEASAAVAVQGRNGARALVLGSEQLLSRHGPLSHALLSWVMHETNTYRLSAFRHFPAGKRSLANPERYKINDLVVRALSFFMIGSANVIVTHWDSRIARPPGHKQARIEAAMRLHRASPMCLSALERSKLVREQHNYVRWPPAAQRCSPVLQCGHACAARAFAIAFFTLGI